MVRTDLIVTVYFQKNKASPVLNMRTSSDGESCMNIRKVSAKETRLIQMTLLFNLIGSLSSSSTVERLVEADFVVMISKTISYSFR